jgi:hypothetical protein
MDIILIMFARNWSGPTYRQRTGGAVPVLSDGETDGFCEVVDDNLGPGLHVRLVVGRIVKMILPV